MLAKISLFCFAYLIWLTGAIKVGNLKQNVLLRYPMQENGATIQTQLSLDANWRWIHTKGGYTNCYNADWDKTICPDPNTCNNNCVLEGTPAEDWRNPYGVSVSGNSLTLRYVTQGQYGMNVGSRVYVVDASGRAYQKFSLLNREISFEADMSQAGCGLNGAVYLVSMPLQGTQGEAGPELGMNYCDAQSPNDIKYVRDKPNLNKLGLSCPEFDLWEANNQANAFTAHACKTNVLTPCDNDVDCGRGPNRQKAWCDMDGGDYNSFRSGNKTLYGFGPNFLVDTSKPFTIRTQFITSDGTDAGYLVEVARYYEQGGRVIYGGSLRDDTIAARKTAFGEYNRHAELGGLRAMGEAIRAGMVLVLSFWDDSSPAQMLWLDSVYPPGSTAAGALRGPCPAGNRDPAVLRQQVPNSQVVYSNIKVGAIPAAPKPPTPTPQPAPTPVPTPQPVNPVPQPTPPQPAPQPFPQPANGNIFSSTTYYVNPTYTQNIMNTLATTTDTQQCKVLNAMKSVGSAYWLDVKSKIMDNSTRGMLGILNDAARTPNQLVVFIIYDLPNRDCSALASNGEICCTRQADGRCDYRTPSDCAAGLADYKTNYIDPIVSVLKQFEKRVPIALIIEPDSLPNLATNMGIPGCANPATAAAYKNGIAYAINSIAAATPSIPMYLDAGHGGWLGWQNNMAVFKTIVDGLGVKGKIRGFATNVANYQPIGVPCSAFDTCLPYKNNAQLPCCYDPCKLASQYNPSQNEANYALQLRSAFADYNPYMVIDTGRSGVDNMRGACANWCNIRGAGLGAYPTSQTNIPYVDALYWLKTPGESDGCTAVLPNGKNCPRFDGMCGSSDSIGSAAGEPRAPEAGAWFDYQIKMLVANAKTVFPTSIWQNVAGCGQPTPAPQPVPSPTPQPAPAPVPSPAPQPTQYWKCQQCVLVNQ